MIIKVPVPELLPGMYVVDLQLSPLEFPHVYPREGLLAESDLRAVKAGAYREAFVDDARSTVPVTIKNPWAALLDEDDGPQSASKAGSAAGPRPGLPAPSAVQSSLSQAVSQYSASIETVERMFSSMKKNGQLPVEDMYEVAGVVVDNIMNDNLTLTTVTRLYAHDNYTFSHCVNVSVLAALFGRHLSMSDDMLYQLALAGLLHDIGKVMIPFTLLNTARPLRESEFELMKTHSMAGYEAIKNARGIPRSAKIAVLEHHERYNGKGYPQRKKGKDISIMGRMMAVVDVYDALTSKRAYKAALLPYTAVSFLFSHRAQDFDPELVDRFIQCVGVYPTGSVVRLNDGSTGVVFLANPTRPLLPVVGLVRGGQGAACALTLVDLAADSRRIAECLDPVQTGIDCATVLKACALAS